MSDVKRVWTAAEVREWAHNFSFCDNHGFGPDWSYEAAQADAAYLARCTRLPGTIKQLIVEHDDCEPEGCDLIDDLRAAIDEEGDK